MENLVPPSLSIKSNKFKKTVFFCSLLMVGQIFFLALIWFAKKDIEEGGSFFVFMAFLSVIILIGVIIFLWNSVIPEYRFDFQTDSMLISTTKIFEKKYLSSESGLIDSALRKQEARGSLDFLFTRLKASSFFIDYKDIEAVFVQSPWNNHILKATSVYFITKNGPIELDYVDKLKINLLIDFLNKQNIRVSIDKEVFFNTPNFLKREFIKNIKQ